MLQNPQKVERLMEPIIVTAALPDDDAAAPLLVVEAANVPLGALREASLGSV